MNVGILSMQRVNNYGSFLQAFALKKMVEELGANVYFIDIEKGVSVAHQKHTELKTSKINNLIQSVFSGKIGHKFLGSVYRRKRKNKFVNKFIPLLELDKKNIDKYDLVIIGSDEVFNACQNTSYGFTPHLFGKGIIAKKVVSYAGSFGFTTMEDIVLNKIDEPIKDALKNLTHISVRDENSFNIIKQLINVEPLIHFDPVLIYDWNEYRKEIRQKEDYLLIYTYHNRITDMEKKTIIDFAKKKNMKLVSINTYYDWCNKSIIPKSPFEVLDYFKYASVIVTDTFHGSIFSIITKSNFCTIVRESNKNKLEYLLNILGQSNRIAVFHEEIQKILSVAPVYIDTERIISYERNETYKYLSKCLSSTI